MALRGETACRRPCGGENRRGGGGEAPLLVDVGILRTSEFAAFDRFKSILFAVVAKDRHVAKDAFRLRDIDGAKRHGIIDAVDAR